MNNEHNNPEMETLISRVFLDFKPEDLLFDENFTEKFIKKLLQIGIEETDIYTLLKDNANSYWNYSFETRRSDKFKEYFYIHIWYLSLHSNSGMPYEHIKKIDKYIQKIAEYILRNEMDLLLIDIKKYIEKYKEELDSWDYNIVDKRNYHDFNPSFLRNEPRSKFYPSELFEKIIEMIPEAHRFEYGPSRFFFPNEENEKIEQEIRPNLNEKNNEIRTQKDFYDMWNYLVTSKAEHEEYARLIAKCGEHFPIKLLRKEIESKNHKCIDGVLQSENEYAISALVSFLNSEDYNITTEYHNVESFSYGKKFTYKKYYKLLIELSIGSHYGNLLYCDKIVIFDLVGIVNSNSIIGQKISKTLEKLNICLDYKLTFEQFNEIEKLEESSAKYEQMKPPKKFNPDTPLFLTEPKNEYERKRNEILYPNNKIPYSLLYEYNNNEIYIKVRFWLDEHKELDLKCYTFDNDTYDMFRNLTLDKPFFFPKLSTENVNIMANYFYRELPFLTFTQQQESLKKDILWKFYWQNLIEKAYKTFKQIELEKPLLPVIPECTEFLLSKTNNIFPTAIENITYNEYKAFLTECRKLQINKLFKAEVLQSEEKNNLTEIMENSEMNLYALSDEEIKKCLLPGTDLEKIHANLESKFMIRVFNKSILWVIEHKDSELWKNAPWFGMQIFNKSYADRPSIWAKHLIRIADDWNGSENMLLRICFALGHLREPLGGEVPVVLQKIADRQEKDSIKRLITIQRNLFNRENFNKGHHHNPFKRVELCKEELIKGQNKEVEGKI